MTMTSLDDDLRVQLRKTPGLLKGDARFAFTFAGQGGEYLAEMAMLRKASVRAKRLIDEVAGALFEHVERMPARDRAFFVEGFDALGWIDAPASAAYMAAVPVSFPLIFLTQLGHYERLRDAGFLLRDRVTLAAGHSQGVMAALAVSLAWEDGELGARAVTLAKFCLQAGLRMQQAWPMRERAADAPTAMAALTGFLHGELQALIGRLPIEITLDNTLYRQVISAEPDVLEAFRARLVKQLAAQKKARTQGLSGGRVPSLDWVYLPVSAPFHSHAMEPARAPLREDAEALGFAWTARDLRLPVLDTETAEPLSGKLLDRLIEIQCVRAVSWRKMSERIAASGALHVIDFGPSDALSKLTLSNLKGAPLHVWPAVHDHIVHALCAPEPPKLPAALDFASPRPRTGPGVFLAGMTPTTVDADIVAAAANAGFTAELAGGGQPTEAILRKRMDELLAKLEPGRAIVFNALYLDPYLWKLHFGGKRLIERLAEEGYPIAGVTISAGVPPLDEAVSVLRGLHRAGVSENSLKPGNDREIGEALAIAKALAPVSLTLQIEGGKAGGHHSWEDLDDLLLRHYPAMRSQANVRIAVGGGIATKESAAPYLNGTWAARYGMRPMPVDQVFIGTAAMATKEAKTSPAVKDALRAAKGTDAWVADRAVSGGVTSGRSQLDASIHYLENAAAAAGRLLDEIAGKVEGRREEIIQALAKTAKPYFGDVEAMSYLQWLERLVALTAIGVGGPYEDGVWPDASYRERFVRCVALAEARLHEDKTSAFRAQVSASEPAEALAQLRLAYPHAVQMRVHPADARAFIEICRMPGKPVCFVPVIDADVRRWYKSDSLWQAHDDRFSAESVLVIPGPASVGAIAQVDRPVAELLRELDTATPRVPRRFECEARLVPTALELEEPARFFARFDTLGSGPLAEMVRAERCFDPTSGRMRVNPLRALLHPEPGLEVHASYSEDGALVSLRSDDASGSQRLSLTHEGAFLHVPRAKKSLDLCLQWRGYLACDRARAIAAQNRFFAETMAQGVREGYAYATADSAGETRGPLTLAFVLAWEEIFAALLSCQVDLLRLVHESISIEATGAWPPSSDVAVRADVLRVESTADGRRVVIAATLRERDAALASIETAFFVREAGLAPDGAPPRSVTVSVRDDAERRFLEEQPWLSDEIAVGEKRSFMLNAENEAALRLLEAPPDASEAALAVPVVVGEWKGRAPKRMDAYAAASGDFNPLHLDAQMARLCGLGAPIVHGMWTAAFAAHRVARSFGMSSDAVRSLQVEFLAPLARDAEISVRVEHTAMREGAPVASVSVVAGDGPVLRATAVLRPPVVAYVFPGQGIQARGMGMAGYARSKAAREVWDAADAYTRRVLGFSLLHVVRENPEALLIAGERVTHPQGVLFLTQFTQVSMVVLAMAQIAEMKAEHTLVPSAYFAGHSVGEYSALSALAGALPLETVVSVVYQRGLTMDRFVPRDEHGRSPYAMGVVRPQYAGLDEQGMFALVDEARGSGALEIVNFNIRGRQYSVTGDTAALSRLEHLLEARSAALRLGKPAYVAVPGIDVPFHSTLLRDGVARFRQTLEEAFPRELDASVLVGRYVPNLIAKAFSLEPSFVDEVRALTGSDRLLGQVDARTLLIELLAYQFASPVRWIETQELLFSEVERFVEVGVAEQPTLMNMALATRESVTPKHSGLRIENSEQRAAVVTSAPVEAAVVAPPAASEAPPAAIDRAHVAIEDRPFTVSAGLRTLLAWHLKLRVEQMQATETLDELCGGNSAKRNQVVADIGLEFSVGAIDGAHELPLEKLERALVQKAPAYRAPGKYLATSIEQRLLPLLQAAHIDPRKYLREQWALGPGLVEQMMAALLLGTRAGESTRGGALSAALPEAAKAAQWIDACVQAFSTRTGLALAKPRANVTAAVDSAALTALEARIFGEQGLVAQTRAFLQAQLPSVEAPHLEPTRDGRLEAYEREHSDEYLRAIAGIFSSEKALALTSAWAWARRDVFRAAHEDIAARPVDTDSAAIARALAERAEREGNEEAAARLRAFIVQEAPARTTVLVTGAGPGSIALALVERLLAQGKRVIASTSSFNDRRLELYRQTYRRFCAPGAELHVVPFNQGSLADCDALVAWLGASDLLPDLVFPFAAVPEIGTLEDIGVRSLVTLRVQLVGVERLLGGLSRAGARAHVVLPLSPNHGVFGGDGVYAETKAALEVLLAKWASEPWGKTLSVTGARIGWVRGTGLMAQNDGLAEALEADTGLKTFSSSEMADRILDRCVSSGAAPEIVSLTGGFEAVADLPKRVATIREAQRLARKLDELRARLKPPARELTPAASARELAPRPRDLQALPPLDHLDLDRVVVVVGYGEVGPWGSARTRWAMERDGVLSLEAAVELAWMMGLVEPNAAGSGFLDAHSKEPVADLEIKARYEERILAGAGIRLVDGARLHGFDPAAIVTHVEVHLDRDFEFNVPTEAAARAFFEADPKHTRLTARPDGSFSIARLRGATLRVPRALALSRRVVGQIPEGWSAERYGIAREMVEQVDRATLFNLVATVEAFLAAGLEPEELYQYMHPSRVGMNQSSGIGGMQKLTRLYQDAKLGRERQSDVLQETLVNVISGWTVQAYIGSYGPISSPVGACATAAVSVADACDKIAAGRADFVVTGGCDDYNEEGAVGFQDMGATADSVDAAARGVSARRLSRPNDARRSGFVEAHGAGTLLLARATTALKMGLPVFGVVAFAASHSDGINASVPAPGQGLLAVASETKEGAELRANACQLEKRRAQIAALAQLPEEIRRPVASKIAHDLARPEISPLRAALAVFGLEADDIAFVSKHDTSTKANDKNENRLHAALQAQLGRSEGLPLYVVSQKSLTGHPKGAAAAWQMIGALQAMADGVLPPNRSLDDVDAEMRKHGALVFSDVPVACAQTLRAALVTSLGFGHVGALVCLLHPAFFWRALGEDERAQYEARFAERERKKTRNLQRVLSGQAPLVVRRTQRPFADKDGSEAHQRHEARVLLDAGARLDGESYR